MTLEPIFGRVKMFGLSIVEIQTPIAPIVHPKMILAATFTWPGAADNSGWGDRFIRRGHIFHRCRSSQSNR